MFKITISVDNITPDETTAVKGVGHSVATSSINVEGGDIPHAGETILFTLLDAYIKTTDAYYELHECDDCDGVNMCTTKRFAHTTGTYLKKMLGDLYKDLEIK